MLHIQAVGCSISSSPMVPRVVLLLSPCIYHHSMVFTKKVYSLVYNKLNLLTSCYDNKKGKSPLFHITPTNIIQVSTLVGIHVIFSHPQPGGHSFMPPLQAYLARPNLGWNIRVLF